MGTAATATATGSGAGASTWCCARSTGRVRKVFVDYAGPTVEVTDRRTGEIHEAKVFVGVLAASNHTFVDVTLTRSLPDWTASHVRMFEYWGGVPVLVIPDNEKAAVHRASRYEPEVNRTYYDLAAHYGSAVLPARPPIAPGQVSCLAMHLVARLKRWLSSLAAASSVWVSSSWARAETVARGILRTCAMGRGRCIRPS